MPSNVSHPCKNAGAHFLNGGRGSGAEPLSNFYNHAFGMRENSIWSIKLHPVLYRVSVVLHHAPVKNWGEGLLHPQLTCSGVFAQHFQRVISRSS